MTSTHDVARSGAVIRADVVVVGDGPAGSALAAALRQHGVDVVLVGPDQAWSATYTTWIDDLAGVPVVHGADIWAQRLDAVRVRFVRDHTLSRPYGVIDNDALRTHLRDGVHHVARTIGSADDVEARLVVDATGWPSKLSVASRGGTADPEPAAWQTAFGVVLAERPAGEIGDATMMDFSEPGTSIAGRSDVATFAYSLPVAGGWLVEETVLAAQPAVHPDLLVPVLAARLGTSVESLLDDALETERVRIPMGTPIPRPPTAGDDGSPVVRFGAAAGMVHPATGYSVGSSLRAADRVAASIRLALDDARVSGSIDVTAIQRAVWPPATRRTRHLHDYGLDVLLRLDPSGVRSFFNTFFEMSADVWPGYLRLDTPPRRLAAIMTAMFRRAPWRLRARLMTGDPRRFVRLLRP